MRRQRQRKQYTPIADPLVTILRLRHCAVKDILSRRAA